ncbi:rCG57903 [Rattus norvegicus]|uniref:RCG57903 n=1 Tax=Rattus norvegicus TaxID=10116 RepID=A6J4W1_RAT|nr:rCG57903 [Rattus norvegicus]
MESVVLRSEVLLQRQEDQVLKVTLGYIPSWRPTRVT